MTRNRNIVDGSERIEPLPDGVVISPATITDSNKKKKKVGRTLAQLPVYRDACNVKYMITQIMVKSPNKMRKFFDLSLANISEVCKSIGFADISRDPQERIWYINVALVVVHDIKNDFIILHKLGITSKDTDNKIRALVKGLVAQLLGWRDYTVSEGVNNKAENGYEQ